MNNTELQLRRMLCLAYAKQPYLDDGELQDNSAHPPIDFKRYSVDEIEAAMQARVGAAFEQVAAQEAALGHDVDAWLEVVDAYGPYGTDIHFGMRCQIVLAEEVKRLRAALASQASKGAGAQPIYQSRSLRGISPGGWFDSANKAEWEKAQDHPAYEHRVVYSAAQAQPVASQQVDFLKHLEGAADAVKDWPDWKKNIWPENAPPPKKQPVEAVFLAELLARIHRDGGHHQAAVGTEQAFRDADAIVVKWLAAEAQPVADALARISALYDNNVLKQPDWKALMYDARDIARYAHGLCIAPPADAAPDQRVTVAMGQEQLKMAMALIDTMRASYKLDYELGRAAGIEEAAKHFEFRNGGTSYIATEIRALAAKPAE